MAGPSEQAVMSIRKRNVEWQHILTQKALQVYAQLPSGTAMHPPGAKVQARSYIPGRSAKNCTGALGV